MKVRQLAVMLVAVLTLAACAGGEEAGEPAASEAATVASEPAPAESEPAAAESEEESEPSGEVEEIRVESSDLGDILVDGEGMTLYVFDNDKDENSTCYDDCEANWPPETDEVAAGEGVDASLLGTSERKDGSQQVTYAGHPLYYFAPDQAPGDTNGQGVGEVWWVVGPDGKAIRDAGGGGENATASSGGGQESADDDGGY